MIRLNLGCGYRKLPTSEGWVNVDCIAQCEPDMVFDIDLNVWPFPDEWISEIRAIHVLEHCSDLSHVMQEAYRVLEPNALMHIAVPHPAGDAWWGDPTHKTPITINTLRLFSKAFCESVREKNWPNTPLALYLDVDFEIIDQGAKLTPPYAARRVNQPELERAMTHSVNVIDELTFTLKRL